MSDGTDSTETGNENEQRNDQLLDLKTTVIQMMAAAMRQKGQEFMHSPEGSAQSDILDEELWAMSVDVTSLDSNAVAGVLWALAVTA